MKLTTDPRCGIVRALQILCKDKVRTKGLSSRLFLITGLTEKGGKSHNPLFKSGKPNPFPLFKLHSLQANELIEKKIPPHRLVTSMKFGPTKRASLFVDAILTPISQIYCGISFIKDTPNFLNKLSLNGIVLCGQGVQLFILDVKALYPSINPVFLPTAVAAALDGVTNFLSARKESILSLVNFTVSNAVVHFRNSWFMAIKGIPTGGSDSVCLANIYMKWVSIKFFVEHTGYKRYVVCWFRFIDDVFGGWIGTFRQFKQFINVFNTFGPKFASTSASTKNSLVILWIVRFRITQDQLLPICM